MATQSFSIFFSGWLGGVTSLGEQFVTQYLQDVLYALITAALHDACSEYRLTKQAHLVVATPAAYARQLAERSAKVATGL
jgi:hypothetical protein